MRVKTTFRHKTYSEYKGGRQKTPPELSEQFPFIREMLDAFNVPRYELENYEADDIMGTLAKEASEQGASVKSYFREIKIYFNLFLITRLYAFLEKGLRK
ncbi:hypothetical protein ACT7DH_23725 [Bacillus pacificus]